MTVLMWDPVTSEKCKMAIPSPPPPPQKKKLIIIILVIIINNFLGGGVIPTNPTNGLPFGHLINLPFEVYSTKECMPYPCVVSLNSLDNFCTE